MCKAAVSHLRISLCPVARIPSAQGTEQKPFTCKDDSVEARLPPELHEVDNVPKPEGRMPGEHHTRLSEVIAEVSMDAGVVLQLIGLNELEHAKNPRGVS